MSTATPTVDIAQIRADHGLAQAKAETAAFGRNSALYGVSYRQGHRSGWWDGVEWLLTAQQGIENLTVGELLSELRKGPGSIYWPVKSDDPQFWADCPRCERPVLIDASGLCSTCGHEFEAVS